jgi:hypothetical protein
VSDSRVSNYIRIPIKFWVESKKNGFPTPNTGGITLIRSCYSVYRKLIRTVGSTLICYIFKKYFAGLFLVELIILCQSLVRIGATSQGLFVAIQHRLWIDSFWIDSKRLEKVWDTKNLKMQFCRAPWDDHFSVWAHRMKVKSWGDRGINEWIHFESIRFF